MEIKSIGTALDLLLKSLPYPEQVKDLEIKNDKAIYFTWRSCRYKFELSPVMVMVVVSNGCVLEGRDSSLLIEHFIKTNINKP